MKYDVSIILPTYNERENIVPLIRNIYKIIKKMFLFEVIVVDDQSPDKTYQVVKEFSHKNNWVSCYQHKGEADLGRSILLGIKKARGRYIIGMDSDFNHDPKYIPLLYEAIENNDLVVGSRFIKNGGMYSQFRYVTSFLFNLILRIFFTFSVYDNTSGFYIIKKKILKELNPESIYYGYGEYHLRLVYKAKQKGLYIREIPVRYTKRMHGKSKSQFLKMFFVYLKTAYQLCKEKK